MDYTHHSDASLLEVAFPVITKHIGHRAFSGCNNLTLVRWVPGIETIGDRAFAGCGSLSVVNFEEGLLTIGKGAFLGCRSLRQVGMVRSVRVIDARAFEGTALENISFFEGLEKIGESAFSSTMGALPSIMLPTTLQILGEFAFSECNIEKVLFLNSIHTISKGAFTHCRSLTEVIVRGEGGATVIGDEAFMWCSDLKRVALGHGIRRIGQKAFMHCSNLTQIELNETLRFVGSSAFTGCSRLQRITFGNGLRKLPDLVLMSCSNLTAVELGEGIEEIGERAFAGCVALTRVRFAKVESSSVQPGSTEQK
eukprot:g2389.t1